MTDARLFHGDCLDRLLDVEDESIDAIVTDPPYGLANTNPKKVAATVAEWLAGNRDHLPGGSGFLNHKWDAFVPPPAVWDQAWRVLTPGGVLAVFAGARTVDLMALSIRLAGFDMLGLVHWVYGSGYPKSRDVTAAVQQFVADGPKAQGTTGDPRIFQLTAHVKAARNAAGWTNKMIDDLFGTRGMAGHWVSSGSQPAAPSARQWQVLKEKLGMSDELDDLHAELAATEKARQAPHGSLSQQVFLSGVAAKKETQGWGTALKPGHEPVVLARKPTPGG